MTCSDFIRWLDEGSPDDAASSAARAHATACAACAEALAAAQEIDRLLEAPVASAPATLADSVMAHIVAIESMRAAQPQLRLEPGGSTFDTTQAWWVRAAAQPAAALSLMLAALTLWQRDALNLHGAALLANASGWIARALDPSRLDGILSLAPAHAAALAKPEVMLGVACAVAPALAWVSASLWRWAKRRV